MFYLDKTDEVRLSIDGSEYVCTRARLGKYLRLSQILRGGINPRSIRTYLLQYNIVEGSAVELLQAFIVLGALNSLKVELPMSKYPPEKREIPWEYVGRHVVEVVHTLAKVYNWDRSTILDLDPDEAFAYLQEIATTEQLEAEWLYSLSPNAYSYDKDSETNKYVPLKRPPWMILPNLKSQKPRPPIPEILMPIGLRSNP